LGSALDPVASVSSTAAAIADHRLQLGAASSAKNLLVSRVVVVHAGNVAAERWFLKLPGVPGESTDAAHKGEIDIESWSWGVRHEDAGGTGGGGAAGRASFQDFHFIARISKASPPLFLACATGSHIKEATLSGVRGAGKAAQSNFVKYRLSDVTVTSFHQSGAADEVPVDQFSLNYTKITYSTIGLGLSGKVDKVVEAGFDLGRSRKL
jgi:type VI secretion system secreted protein Hcp